MNLSVEIEILMVGFSVPSYEHIWLDIKHKNLTFCINALYRQPLETVNSHTQFIDTCDDILLNITNHTAKYKIMTSDLNFGNC